MGRPRRAHYVAKRRRRCCRRPVVAGMSRPEGFPAGASSSLRRILGLAHGPLRWDLRAGGLARVLTATGVAVALDVPRPAGKTDSLKMRSSQSCWLELHRVEPRVHHRSQMNDRSGNDGSRIVDRSPRPPVGSGGPDPAGWIDGPQRPAVAQRVDLRRTALKHLRTLTRTLMRCAEAPLRHGLEARFGA